MAVTVRCSACGTPVIPGAKQCSGCGLQLAAQAVAVRDRQRGPLLTIPRLLIMAVAILALAVFIQTQWQEEHAASGRAALLADLHAGKLQTAEAFTDRCGAPRVTLRDKETGHDVLLYAINRSADLAVTLTPGASPAYAVQLQGARPKREAIALDEAIRDLPCGAE